MLNTYKKSERLCSRKAISDLVANGKSFFDYPFKTIWLETPTLPEFPAQIMFSVSKKNFKRAVKRNYVKRCCREAYRKNKQLIYNYLTENNLNISILIIFVSKTIMPYQSIENKMIATLNHLISEIKK